MNRHRLIGRCVAVGVGLMVAAVAGLGLTGDGRVDAADRAVVHTVVVAAHSPRPLVALTFDDGPDPRWTPQVVSLLARYGAHATFFAVGRNALAHPGLVTAELAGGSEVANHTYDHADLRLLDAPGIRSELERGAKALEAVGAPHPSLFRPPYGHGDETVGTIADAERYRTIMWNLCVERFVDRAADPRAGVHRLLARVHPGTIILAHDGGVPDRVRTMASLPVLLEGLAARGYRIVDVSELMRSADAGLSPPRHSTSVDER